MEMGQVSPETTYKVDLKNLINSQTYHTALFKNPFKHLLILQSVYLSKFL